MPNAYHVIERANKIREVAVCLSSIERSLILVAIMRGASTYEDIMNDTGMGYEPVKRQTHTLRKAGLVKTQRKGYGGRLGGHTKISLCLADDLVSRVAELCGVRLAYFVGPAADIDRLILKLKQKSWTK